MPDPNSCFNSHAYVAKDEQLICVFFNIPSPFDRVPLWIIQPVYYSENRHISWWRIIQGRFGVIQNVTWFLCGVNHKRLVRQIWIFQPVLIEAPLGDFKFMSQKLESTWPGKCRVLTKSRKTDSGFIAVLTLTNSLRNPRFVSSSSTRGDCSPKS